MSDTAKLRAALEVLAAAEFDDEFVEEAVVVIEREAHKRLAQMEAGALIITPDEKTVERLNQEVTSIISECTLLYVDRNVLALRILDALRDAMPDGET